ncbi:MAG: tetratricopeptide repeat protein [Alphaproteobacteria bacterium]|nr:tetratricopeptide repeat protein [Alphaproteobacteria bacterium]
MERALQHLLEAAFKSHQAGQLEEAERSYRKLLRRDPLNPDGLHLLGLLVHQRGKSAEAEELIGRAIRRRPDATFFENLAAIQRSAGALDRAVETCRVGLAQFASASLAAILLDTLLDLGKFGDALELLDRLARREPVSAARLADRAFCLVRLGRREEAARAAESALVQDVANGNALAVLAELAADRGDHAAAADLWRRALAGRPDWIAAKISLGLALIGLRDGVAALELLLPIAIPADADLAVKLLNGLSAAYLETGRRDHAARCLERALALAPASPDLLSNLSEMRRLAYPAYALTLAERAIVVDDGSAGAHGNRGLALEELDRLAESIGCVRRAISLVPSDARFLNNLAGSLRWYGRFHDGQLLHRRSIAADPSFAPAWYGLGTSQLMLGDLESGWDNYDWRTQSTEIQAVRPFSLPLWRGPRHRDEAVLVWGEQGLGDELVYGSMLPDLARDGVRAVVECDARMISLFQRVLPTLEFVAVQTRPDERLARSDVTSQLPMGSLGRWYRKHIRDFPENAYLTPRPDLLERWRTRLAALGDGPKIGFAWRSSRSDALSRRFHPPVLEWEPVLSQRQATFVSLQYGESESDIGSVEAQLGTRIHRFPDLDLRNDLENVLALSAALDMTISSGTTAFCLPAAVGSPVWLLVPEHDFWAFGTDRYPWFPSVRLYRRRYVDPWSRAIAPIGTDLASFLRDRPGTGL